MSGRAAAWLAWGMWAITLIACVPDQYLSAVNPGSDPVAINLIGALVFMGYATVGALIVSRRPRNTVGWLLCVTALLMVSSSAALNYAIDGLVTHPGSLPGAIWFAAIGGPARSLGFYLIVTFLLLLFPSGRLPSPRWRWLAWVTAVVITVTVLIDLFGPDFSSYSDELTPFVNPLSFLPPDIAGPLQTVFAFLLTFACVIGCVASVIVRYRRAGGVERQQIKWLALAGAWAALGFLLVLIGALTNNNALANAMMFYVLLVGIPIAVGIAILRHRLFDIDVIINRALVYGLLTALLATLYFAGVAGAQALVNLVTRQAQIGSPVIVVLTTLLLAALFTPLRRAIQSFIDHRFYRSKYDAAVTLERFSETLRTDVDLSALTRHLVNVVDDTMRPAHVSLWLRGDQGSPAR